MPVVPAPAGPVPSPAAPLVQPGFANPLIAARDAHHSSGAKRVSRVARHIARLRDSHVPRKYTRVHLRDDSVRSLARTEVHLRRTLRHLKRRAAAEQPAAAVPGVLQSIASCESGSDPSTDTGNGFYGKYQFTLSTWQAVGGSGNPAQAPEGEQDRRAAQLYRTAGAGQWPVCGR